MFLTFSETKWSTYGAIQLVLSKNVSLFVSLKAKAGKFASHKSETPKIMVEEDFNISYIS